MHAHSHITQAVAAMDNCFALIGAHHHGITVGSINGEKSCLKDPLLLGQLLYMQLLKARSIDTPTHVLASTSCMHTAISRRQWCSYTLIAVHHYGQHHTTHVRAVGWECGTAVFPNTYAGKSDHGLVYVCP